MQAVVVIDSEKLCFRCEHPWEVHQHGDDCAAQNCICKRFDGHDPNYRSKES